MNTAGWALLIALGVSIMTVALLMPGRRSRLVVGLLAAALCCYATGILMTWDDQFTRNVAYNKATCELLDATVALLEAGRADAVADQLRATRKKMPLSKGMMGDCSHHLTQAAEQTRSLGPTTRPDG